MTRVQKAAAKKLDAEIDRLYKKNFEGIQINIMDIPKVFDVARQAHAEGRDMKEAMESFMKEIRKN